MTDLRTLAQAVDDAARGLRRARGREDYTDALEALDAALGVSGCLPLGRPAARAILAALDAADAQGYARAMGEVVERADPGPSHRWWSDYACGWRDAAGGITGWARARLTAAAEKEHGG